MKPALLQAPGAGQAKPHAFIPATWRGTLPPDPRTGEQGISFNLADGRVLRLWLPPQAVASVKETLGTAHWKALACRHSSEPSIHHQRPRRSLRRTLRALLAWLLMPSPFGRRR
jgi:hypothetical protein